MLKGLPAERSGRLAGHRVAVRCAAAWLAWPRAAAIYWDFGLAWSHIAWFAGSAGWALLETMWRMVGLLGLLTQQAGALHDRHGQPQPELAPIVTLHLNTNNVAGAPWRESGAEVKYLGLFNTTQECEWACLSGPPPLGSHCCAFTFHTAAYALH